MRKLALNTEVAAGWIQYGGLDQFNSYLIDPTSSLQLIQSASEWAERAAEEFAPHRGMTVSHGECTFSNGTFAGRFLALGLDKFWGGGGFALAVSVRDAGGDRNGGALVASSEPMLRGAVEDIGRAMCLDQLRRREGVRAALSKWEDRNPPEWRSRYRSVRGAIRRFLSWIVGR